LESVRRNTGSMVNGSWCRLHNENDSVRIREQCVSTQGLSIVKNRLDLHPAKKEKVNEKENLYQKYILPLMVLTIE